MNNMVLDSGYKKWLYRMGIQWLYIIMTDNRTVKNILEKFGVSLLIKVK